ncbi:cation/calcium exchanger 1-like [Rhododendron vialii]|uniref:cation/calcium exchanger 1-like n=1 Tax=Rhododendron vialii TaxID=182163 RepID=UPI00265E827E|nr:cation/calcium exchanger 1-like [Rhododendron vialii]
MAGHLYMHKSKCLLLFLNTSFLFLICLLITHLISSPNSDLHFLNLFKKPNPTNYHQFLDTDIGCEGLHRFPDIQSKCSYVNSHKGCQLGGYIPYLHLFYCSFPPFLGHTSLLLWLLILFYLLGDTSASYFCSSLEGLSKILKLSPTIAGVTLLSLGNGAPDLFASIVSFMGESTNEVGLNSILGGAFFVSTAVVGIISICVCPSQVSIDKSSFVRDVLFLLLSLLCLLVIIIFGTINLLGAISFLSLYFVYVFLVSVSELCSKDRGGNPILPLASAKIYPNGDESKEKDSELGAPLLLKFVDDERPVLVITDEVKLQAKEDGKGCLNSETSYSICLFLGKILWILQLPLSLPRRLTIPVISEERWSKPCAVISVTLAPILLALVWSSKGPNFLIYGVGGSVGAILGSLVFFKTNGPGPPRKWLFPWLAGGFLMSITWTYILAQELVSLLVSIGLIVGISPSLLGLTVLAWGNSLGDLVANVTMARKGGPDGVQVAISGCYAGPIFNTLVGLGLSLVFAAWAVYPSCYVLPRDAPVYETLGFLMGGLLWALVVLPKNNMRPDRLVAAGLLAIYLCFLFLKLARTLGLVQFHESLPHFRT